MSRPRILVAREVFPEVIERLRQDFEVDDNQADVVLGVEGLKARLADKVGVMTAVSDPVTAEVLAAAPELRAVCNFAVGYNNIDGALGDIVAFDKAVINAMKFYSGKQRRGRAHFLMAFHVFCSDI